MMEEGKENGGNGTDARADCSPGEKPSGPHIHKMPPGTVLKSRTMNMFFGGSGESDESGDNLSELLSPTFSIGSGSGGGGAKRFWNESSSWILSRIGSGSSFDKDGRRKGKGKFGD